jgi:hypothetical protein
MSKKASYTNRTFWRCQCECGKVVLKPTSHLRSGHSRSCGCLHDETLAANSEKRRLVDSAYRRSFRSYIGNARARKVTFEMTYDQFRSLVGQDCHYCGEPPGRRVWRHEEVAANGVDRLNNDKGYVAGNMVPCCAWCNRAKQQLSAAEFAERIAKAYRHLHRGDEVWREE